MKTKISFILSLISLVGVLSIWGLWIFGSMKLSVVSLDTFSYRNCLSEIYEQTMQAFWQKMKMLGLVVENK